MAIRTNVMTAACAAALALSATAQAAPALRHGYVDMRYGQLHYSIARPSDPGAASKPPIILLHQSPNSSVEFDALVAALGHTSVAIAIDTPGYGGSDGPAAIPTIEDYAGAIAEALHNLGYGPGRPVNLFGYHTGSKIAVELAIREPAMVKRLALSGIFIVSPERLEQATQGIVHPASAAAMFERFCTNLPQTEARYTKAGVPDLAWGRIRVDSMRALTHQEFGHAAAFAYAPRFKARIAEVTQPTELIVMDDGLAKETAAAKPMFRHAVVADPGLTGGAFFTQPQLFADTLTAFFDAR